MKRMLAALVMAIMVGALLGAPLRADCICDKVSMYPVGGNLWMHYAMVYDDNCMNPYPTGHIGIISSGENCTTPNCGQCSPLGNPPPFGDLHFGKTDPLPKYDAIKAPADFQHTLESIAGGLAGSTYNNWNFDLIGVVEIVRPSDATKLYAVVFRMTKKVGVGGSTPQGVVGFEIEAPAAGTYSEIEITYQCNAVAEGATADLPIPGLLEVELKSTSEVAFIRLQDTIANRNAKFEPCIKPDHTEFESLLPGVEPGVSPDAGRPSCNTYYSSQPRCHWRRHCRPFRRGCR
jgi:hypothetical protein